MEKPRFEYHNLKRRLKTMTLCVGNGSNERGFGGEDMVTNLKKPGA